MEASVFLRERIAASFGGDVVVVRACKQQRRCDAALHTCCSKTSASAFKNSRIRDLRSSIISRFSCSNSAAIFLVSARCLFPTSVTSFEFAHSHARIACACSLMPVRRSVMTCDASSRG